MADFKIPSQPVNLFPMPFADEGAKTIIPDATTLHGRATIPGGFPNETQLTLTQGGVAPNRLDFQGMFYMLSAFAFWQQSGGMFNYNPALNYITPSVVYHNDVLWWCEIANGPATDAGEQEPGIEAGGHWSTFFSKIAGNGGEGGGLVPVGTVISGWWNKAPDGYFALDGTGFDVVKYPRLAGILGGGTLPNRQGLFVRGYDPTAINDPSGASRLLGDVQQDMGRRLRALFPGPLIEEGWTPSEAGFLHGYWTPGFYPSNKAGDFGLGIDSHLTWGAASGNEFRGKNFCLLHCIKHD